MTLPLGIQHHFTLGFAMVALLAVLGSVIAMDEADEFGEFGGYGNEARDVDMADSIALFDSQPMTICDGRQFFSKRKPKESVQTRNRRQAAALARRSAFSLENAAMELTKQIGNLAKTRSLEQEEVVVAKIGEISNKLLEVKLQLNDVNNSPQELAKSLQSINLAKDTLQTAMAVSKAKLGNSTKLDAAFHSSLLLVANITQSPHIRDFEKRFKGMVGQNLQKIHESNEFLSQKVRNLHAAAINIDLNDIRKNMPAPMKERLTKKYMLQNKMFENNTDDRLSMIGAREIMMITSQMAAAVSPTERAKILQQGLASVMQKVGLPMVPDGPFASGMNTFLGSDPQYQQHFQVVNSFGSMLQQPGGGVTHGNMLSSVARMMASSPYVNANSNAGTLVRGVTYGMQVAGPLVNQLFGSLSQAQNVQIMQTQQELNKNMKDMSRDMALLKNQSSELLTLAQQQTIEEEFDQILAAMRNFRRTSLQILKTAEKINDLTIGTNVRIVSLINELSETQQWPQFYGTMLNDSLLALNVKADAADKDSMEMHDWTNRVMKGVEKKLEDTNKLIDKAEETVSSIAGNLASFSKNQLTESGNHNAAINGNIEIALETLDKAYDKTQWVNATIFETKGSINFLDPQEALVEANLLELLVQAKRTKLIASYNEVINRLRSFQRALDKISGVIDPTQHKFRVNEQSIKWANSVLYGDSDGMSMDEVLFKLDSMITGKSLAFQRGSILDWYMDAADVQLNLNPDMPSERWYIELVVSYLMSLKINGYSLMSLAHVILGNSLASTETCLAMEQNLWRMDKLFALYIEAASPKMRMPPGGNNVVSLGSTIGLAKLAYDPTKMPTVGEISTSQLLTCRFCKGCDFSWPEDVLSMQCRFRNKENSARSLTPESSKERQLVQRGSISLTRDLVTNTIEVPFVAGTLRLKQPQRYLICGAFLSKRKDSGALSVGVHVCERMSGRVVGIDDGSEPQTPIPSLVLRDGNDDSGLMDEHIEKADHVMTAWQGIRNTDSITEIGLASEIRRQEPTAANLIPKTKRILTLRLSAQI